MVVVLHNIQQYFSYRVMGHSLPQFPAKHTKQKNPNFDMLLGTHAMGNLDSSAWKAHPDVGLDAWRCL